MATKMSAKMQRVYEDIKSMVEYARNTRYDEWRGNCPDYGFLRARYEEQRGGLVHGLWDGRTLSALEKRGLIRYFDDMDEDNWTVRLIEAEGY